jgi:hypothetical protein
MAVVFTGPSVPGTNEPGPSIIRADRRTRVTTAPVVVPALEAFGQPPGLPSIVNTRNSTALPVAWLATSCHSADDAAVPPTSSPSHPENYTEKWQSKEPKYRAAFSEIGFLRVGSPCMLA